MADFATTPDVENAWRILTDDETTAAGEWLAYASAIIRTEIPTIDSRIAAQASPSPLAAVAKGVTVAMVLRRMQNPDGYRSVQESIEDYSTTRTRDSALSSGGIALTDEERLLLLGRRKAFSVTPGNERPTLDTYERIVRHRRWREIQFP